MSRARGQATIPGAAVVASIVFVGFWVTVLLAPDLPAAIDKMLGSTSVVVWIVTFLFVLFNA